MKKYLILIICALALSVIIMGAAFDRSNRERKRHQENENELLRENESWKTEHGKSAMEVQRLTIEKGDIEKYFAEALEQIEDLKIKNKRIKKLLQAGTETNVVIKTVIRDSIIYVKDSSYHVGKFDWKDSWTSIHGIIKSDSIDIKYNQKDTLSFVTKRIPRKFLFIKWGTKRLEMNVINSNPNNEITYSREISIK